MWKGILAGTTALCMKLGWYCTIAVSAWCSAHQIPRCECAVKVSCKPLMSVSVLKHFEQYYYFRYQFFLCYMKLY